ncbi:hypothetical protein SASPL_122682 [Salvia splendens]|uniref:Uncharacterized protein n=1 Tax=Salvia splendens TaxID=180675 RepID=A0A8X8XPR9_SALSN|nr:hypothetical protein SASPL_122682 [Salvia splendens]
MCSVPSISQLYDIAGQPFLWGDGESMPECQVLLDVDSLVMSSHSGCKIVTMANKDSAPVTRAFDSSAEVENSVECDWRKHVSPDGDLYYYNCVACESRVRVGESCGAQYAIYEQELDGLEEQQNLHESNSHTFFPGGV